MRSVSSLKSRGRSGSLETDVFAESRGRTRAARASSLTGALATGPESLEENREKINAEIDVAVVELHPTGVGLSSGVAAVVTCGCMLILVVCTLNADFRCMDYELRQYIRRRSVCTVY